MLASYRKETYQSQPVDIIARVRQNEDLVKLQDENIRMISASLSIQLNAKAGDIVQIEGQRYRIGWIKDSLGVRWLHPIKLVKSNPSSQM